MRGIRGNSSSRTGARDLGKLSPRAVHVLRQSGFTLIGRAVRGTPAQLRAHAERLRCAQDELRFRIPAFAAYLGDVAAIADETAQRLVSARVTRAFIAEGGTGTRLAWPTHGLAKFSRR